MSPSLTVQDLTVHYEGIPAVERLSFHLSSGEIGCLLGPSGCGKTSVLRAIAGFEDETYGNIRLDERELLSDKVYLTPDKRGVGFIFQHFALFPHLSVRQNIRFGLTRLAAREQQQACDRMLALTKLEPFADMYPHQLSGGQKQRVAIARALAPKPGLVLLDEPFSSLDAELRLSIASDVRELFKAENITALMVTHDQHEAFAIADSIGVMQAGALMQWDTPYRLYHNPATRFVAEFIGEGSLISASVNEFGDLSTPLGIHSAEDLKAGDHYDILFRPDDVRHNDESALRLPIVRKRFRGAENYFDLKLPDGQTLVSIAPSHVNPNVGESLGVETDLKHLVLFKR